MKHRPFASQGGFTVFDNYILDYIMPELKPPTWKILCFIIRKTVGWQKVEDSLSYSQIMAGTGIGNRNTVSAALKELVKRQYIIRKVSEGHSDANIYRLNTEYEVDDGSIKIVPGGSIKNVPEGSTNLIHTKETEKEIHSAEALSLREQFQSLLEKLRTERNKPPVLKEIYVMCYGETDVPDYGYLGKAAKKVGGAGYLATRLWELSARPPNGDVLAYILGEHKRKDSYQKKQNGNVMDLETLLGD